MTRSEAEQVLAVLKAVQFAGKEHYRYSSYTEGDEDVCPLCDIPGYDPWSYSKPKSIQDILEAKDEVRDSRHEKSCPLDAAITTMVKEVVRGPQA